MEPQPGSSPEAEAAAKQYQETNPDTHPEADPTKAAYMALPKNLTEKRQQF